MRGKREIHRKLPGGGLIRGADGRLRPASDGIGLDDIWAEQKRLQLKEAILRDKKKAARRERWRRPFSGRKTTNEPRTVEIKIQMPRLSTGGAVRWFSMLWAKVPRPRVKKKLKFAVGAGIVTLLLIIGIFSIFGDDSIPKRHKSEPSVLSTQKQANGPQYNTVLPVDKSIEDLGGWGRVSPPDKDPVYAYADVISGVRIIVSQQPLPDNLKKDTEEEVAKLAEGFNANEKIHVGDVTAHIGTSAEGPQSAILTKNDLLLLIKSDSEIAKEQWMAYIGSLR